jgi:GT2 family glycosyltransferase
MPDRNAAEPTCTRSGAHRPTLGILICTYQRPLDLGKCLYGLAGQTRPPDDIVVIARPSDQATWDWLDAHRAVFPSVRSVPVMAPGLVAARNAGLDACRTDLLAFVDDDVVPHHEWARRVCKRFEADPELGGLGGRDHVHDGEQFDERLAKTVGRIQWFGRVIGNHHLGYGLPRPVMILKGANMTYRRTAVGGARFDSRLRGRTTQPHDDMAFSLAVRRNGWKLVYDPSALVYHFAGRPEQRAYSSVKAFVPEDVTNTAFNLVIALWGELSPPRRIAFIIWSLLIGTRTDPGFLQAVRYTPSLGIAVWRRTRLTLKGKLTAVRMLMGSPAAPEPAPAHGFPSRGPLASADHS